MPLKHISFDTLLGFGGMHPSENQRAIRAASYFEPIMLVFALWIAIEWLLASKGRMPEQLTFQVDWIIWVFFVIETTTLSILADKPLKYLARNWAHLVIIILAVPYIYETLNHLGTLRLVRLFLFVGYTSRHFTSVRAVLTQNHLGKALLVAAMLITGAGIFISTIEPNIKTYADGIWWAWVTVTTVGYGDLVPVTEEGRIFASILIFVGVVLVSFMTANISAYLLSKGVEQEFKYEQHELKHLIKLEHRITILEEKIDALLEQQQARKPSDSDSKDG